jgi:hypothetical protein
LGHGSVASIIWRADAAVALVGIAEESEFCGGSPDGAPLDEYLGWVAMDIREYGWVSRSAARDGMNQATADSALMVMYAPYLDNKGNIKPEPTEEDFERAQKALKWVAGDLESVKSDRELNDYQHNLSVIIRNKYSTTRQAGYAASIINYFERGIARVAERRQAAKAIAHSEHVGNRGERINLQGATIQRIHSFEGNYGTTYIYNMLHAGNVLCWFASRRQEVKVGDTINVTGTVKSHGEYKGTNQTTLTRCKLTVC